MKPIEEQRVRHLEMIQAVIARMADLSLAMKAFAVVMQCAGIFMALAFDLPEILLGMMVLIVVFWMLDAKYLQQEKWFRDMFDAVRGNPEHLDYTMTPGREIRKTTIFWGLFSWSTVWMYVPFLTFGLSAYRHLM